jgi:hypothetical protein
LHAENKFASFAVASATLIGSLMDSKNPNDAAIREGDPPYRSNDNRDEERRLDYEKSQRDLERQKRTKGRFYATLWAVGIGLMFIFMFDGYLIGSVPAPWVGWFVIGVAILGLLGVNVYSGGPLDYRLDDTPPPTDPNESK